MCYWRILKELVQRHSLLAGGREWSGGVSGTMEVEEDMRENPREVALACEETCPS